MLRRSRRTDAEVEAFKRTLRSPICEVPGCLGLNDDVPGGVEGINCITYQTETGTRVVWLCDTHRATVTRSASRGPPARSCSPAPPGVTAT